MVRAVACATIFLGGNMGNAHYGKMMIQDAFGVLNRCARYAGFGFCIAWGFLLFAVPEFQPSSGLGVFLWSMAPGCLACLFVIAISRRWTVSPTRSGVAFCCSALASIGTFLHASPIASSQGVQYAGLVLAGASFIGLLLPWFVAYTELSAREVFLSSGLALVVGSVTCVIVSVCDCEIAGFALSVLPVISLLLLPAEKTSGLFGGDSVAGVERSLFRIIKAAIPTKTLAGLLLVYFVIDALRGIGRLPGSFLGRADASFLVIPLLVSLGCVFVAAMRRKIDLGVACKLLLAVFSISLALSVVALHPGFRFGFATSVCTQALCWMLLVFVAKKSPVSAQIVFAIGMIAEFVGGILADLVMPAIAPIGMLAPLVLVLAIVFATVFVFSDESLVIEIDYEEPVEMGDGQLARRDCLKASGGCILATPHQDKTDAASISSEDETRKDDDKVSEFCAAHGLTARESEVFSLWITGHDMRTIQEKLFVSQGTVKTHLRNIYDKCGVHNRRDLMKMFEG